MINFLASFWNNLFENAGVMGLFLVIAIPAGISLAIALLCALISKMAKKSKETAIARLRNSAKELEKKKMYEQAYETWMAVNKKKKLSLEDECAVAQLCSLGKKAGWSVTDKNATAEYWLKNGMENESAHALFTMGCIKADLANTDPLESAKGINLIRRAAEKNHTKAKEYLKCTEEWCVSNRDATDHDIVEKAAAWGHAESQFKLYSFYLEEDINVAFAWCKLSAEQGYGKAQLSLGLLYIGEHGINKNYDLALHWLNKAKNQGLAKASLYIGIVYGYKAEELRVKRKLSYKEIIMDAEIMNLQIMSKLNIKEAAEQGCEEAVELLKEY